MANGDDELIHWIHTLWSAGITVIGGLFAGIVKWNWDKLNTELDKKANKQEMADTLTALRDDFQNWQERSERWRQDQDNKHAENRQRLDTIIMKLWEK